MPVLTIHPATKREHSFQWSGPRCDLGRSANNHLQLDDGSISSYHARIEKRGEAYVLIDLNSTNGSFINDRPAREVALRDGDTIRLGEHVELRFACPAEEPTLVSPTVVLPPPQAEKPAPQATVIPLTPVPPAASAEPVPPVPPMSANNLPVNPGMSIQTVGPGSSIMPQGAMCPACRAMVPFQVNFCPRCGFSLAQQAPLGFPMAPQPIGFVRPTDQPGGMSIGMMPMLALLCGVLGFLVVPAGVAILLGLAALGQIRRLGGMESDRKQAMWGISLGVFWLLIALAVGGVWGYGKYQDRQQVAAREREKQLAEQQVVLDKEMATNEGNAITLLQGIARAQKLVKTIRLLDPNQTGTGQYMPLAGLLEAGTSFVNRDLAGGKSRGYVFSIRDAGAAQYLAVAEPERYKETGRLTFTIDPSGMVRGKDCEGKSLDQVSGALPVLSDVKSAYEGVDDAIAAEAIAHAKRLASQGKYEQCQLILDEVAVKYAMTTAAQELAAIKKTVDPFILEAQAQRKHLKATEALGAGDMKLAIALLKEVVELYPTYSKITTVTDDLNLQQTALTQRLDKEAKELFDKAEALEREGQPATALELYVQIEKNYAETEWGKRITELRPALQKSIREKSAEELFAQVRDLSVTNDYRNIVNVIEQLQRGYSDTDYVSQNKSAIDAVFVKAQAQQYRALAIEQMNAGKDTDALARLEEACAKVPDSRLGYRDLFLKLYVRVGRKRMDEGDFREALRLYRSYMTLEPEESELDPALISKLQFSLARTEFAQGNYNNAAQLLIGARKAFEKEADYNDLFGSVQVALGHYLDALTHFDRAITIKPTVGNYYARRGYTQLLLALQIEREAMVAYAGLLKDTTAKKTTSKASKTNTNAPSVKIVSGTDAPAAEPVATSHDEFAPVFATVLPPTASGVKPEMQVRYDAVASQTLLTQVLDLLDEITATNTSSKVRNSIRPAAPKTKNNNSSNNDDSSVTPGSEPPGSRARDRLNRIRTTVEFNNTLSSMRQRINDNNARRNRSVEAMRKMSLYFSGGNRDLLKAIELAADRAPQLVEIQKSAAQHERRIAQAVPLIVSYLATETDVIEKVCNMTESVYQNMRIQHISTPIDPTGTLDIYFSRYFDRREFDQGIQILREAAAIEVPLSDYALIPVLIPAPTPPISTTPVVAPAVSPPAKAPRTKLPETPIE